VKLRFGADTTKWLIRRRDRDGRWTVCPPTNIPGWPYLGGVFSTGAEALAAFAAGGRK
jgi:hypothetical protein